MEMKKLIIGLMLLFFVAGNTWAADEFSFRGTKWGMTEAEVKKIEKGTLAREARGVLIYEVGTVLGMDAACGYTFNKNDELYMAAYFFKLESVLDYSKHIENYNKVKNTVIEKYGRPTEDEVVWRDKMLKDNMYN